MHDTLTPAEKAAATRRIRKRAKAWREIAPRYVCGFSPEQQSELELAQRPMHFMGHRPPIAKALLLEFAAENVKRREYELIDKRHGARFHRSDIRHIAGIRRARAGLAALRCVRDTYPQATNPEGIKRGDLIEVERGELSRVVAVTVQIVRVKGRNIVGREYGPEEYRFTLENGATYTVPEGWQIPALRDREPDKDDDAERLPPVQMDLAA